MRLNTNITLNLCFWLLACHSPVADESFPRSVAAHLCVGLAETITKLGSAFIEGSTFFWNIVLLSSLSSLTMIDLEKVSRIAVEILEQKAFCQQDPDQDETEEAPEDQAEYDSVLISSAGDLVASLATALGPDFTPAFNTFLPLISKYYVRVSPFLYSGNKLIRAVEEEKIT